jgi:hypothetical protein
LQNTSADNAVVPLIALAAVAPFLRYLIGTVLIDTGGSILAVGILHASFNATATLSAADGGWQLLPALLVLVGVVGVHRRLRRTGADRIDGPSRRPEIDGTTGQPATATHPGSDDADENSEPHPDVRLAGNDQPAEGADIRPMMMAVRISTPRHAG